MKQDASERSRRDSTPEPHAGLGHSQLVQASRGRTAGSQRKARAQVARAASLLDRDADLTRSAERAWSAASLPRRSRSNLKRERMPPRRAERSIDRLTGGRRGGASDEVRVRVDCGAPTRT